MSVYGGRARGRSKVKFALLSLPISPVTVMASLYKGVYSAIYDYDATTPEELSVAAGDLLYILEISNVDDWWTVKKRALPIAGQDVDEPVGLVPSNYIEQAPVVATCTTLYDYDKQTEEELSFKEGEVFDIYDTADPDWLLAGNGTAYGFLPSNYVTLSQGSAQGVTQGSGQPQHQAQNQAQIGAQTGAQMQTQGQPQTWGQNQTQEFGSGESLNVPASGSGATHNQFRNRAASTQERSGGTERGGERSDLYDLNGDKMEASDGNGNAGVESEDEAPPPMPTRPGSKPASTVGPTQGSKHGPSKFGSEQEEDLGSSSMGAGDNPSPQHGFDGEYFRWYIDEVDGRKKRPVVLAIGNGLIILKPNSSNPKKLSLKSASSLDNNWRIRDLVNYNQEKKHVFFDFKNPQASIELHGGTKDVAEAIIAVLGDLKGAEEARGLKEVARAASTKTSESNKRVGVLLFDFKAQSNDELSCKEGDEVYVVDSKKSKEWWLCERVSDGRQGVIPSTYIEIIATTNLDKLTDGVQRRKSKKASPSKGRVVETAKTPKFRDRDDRDRIRESDRKKRVEPSAKAESNMPNFHRIRTWIDSSGSFKVEAEFLGFKEGKVHLHKTNGVKIAVQATKLSIEDLEYVEKVADVSLDKYKEELAKQSVKRERARAAKSPTKSATAVINDVAPPKPDRAKATPIPQSEPDYDWFDFFLSCGVDIGNCQRYSVNFSKEQMDETILEDITPSLLRSLGLREGDILRVMKHLDHKFHREKSVPSETPTGGLFTEPTGALKNNSTTELSKVTANALPVPVKEAPKNEDDAWAIKPASRSNEAPKPQFTGSLQDLVDIQPLDGKSQSVVTAPAAEPLTPVKTQSSAPQQQMSMSQSKEKELPEIKPAQTGLTATRTGGLVPVPTGGLIPVQPTGFIPIPAQPTGFIPIQATSGLMPQPTFGIVQLQPGITTFPMPQTTFNQPQLNQTGQTSFNTGQTGQTSFNQASSFNQPQTSFTSQPTASYVPLQPTASFVPLQPGTTATMPQTSFGQAGQMTGQFGQTGQMTGQRTGGQSTDIFGQMTGQRTGGIANAFVPQSSFGKQITGGFMASNQTGGAQPYQTTFGQSQNGMSQSFGQTHQTSFGQATGGFGQATGGFGQTGAQNFNSGVMPQTSFGAQATGGYANPAQYNQDMNQMNNMFQNTSIQPPIGQASFGQAPMGQTSFGQPPIGQTSFGQPPIGQASFGQQQFEGFGNQPLVSQPTGLGFGNSPALQNQPTGKRANLQAATADNPFGF